MSTKTKAPEQNHHLFDRYPDYQWTGSLPALFDRLKSEARKQPDGRFAWRVLRRGAVVGVRVHPKLMRLELKIARSDPTETQEKQARWQHEVGVFLREFGVTATSGETPAESEHDHWIEHEDPDGTSKTEARFLQLRKGETEPGKARCHRCRLAGVAKTVEWFLGASPKGQACMAHAFEAGAEYTATVRARLGLD